MLGWFGGLGFSRTAGFFAGTMHMPATFFFLAIAAEFFGSLGLILGLLTRNRRVRRSDPNRQSFRSLPWRPALSRNDSCAA
jgi:hypothetical protein